MEQVITPADMRPVASQRSTTILCTIVMLIALAGLASQHVATAEVSPATQPAGQMSVYVWLIFGELMLLRFVYKSMKASGGSLAALISQRPVSARGLLRDAALAVGLTLVWFAVEWGLMQALGDGNHVLVKRLVLHQAVELPLWIVLSVCAGVVEEITFRGFMQRQFMSLSGSRWAGVLMQAPLFGIAHLYQGIVPCIHIMVFGLIFGFVAAQRRSLIPGIFAHAAIDLSNVVALFG